ncbi:type II toxin-antitoxin system RelE/ParE family toxin [Stieleria sp. JC731]|uniref:type II toxin-antitoxin system RelE/ParE family toxin n=1 Tax=Pirellulaceae TaxID=2691357 RepID=UPI001E577D9C|nr:type II toxin-antitoxin system RelE/ParE family toxin [Stieleria sp. JC731]MCC9602250.1 type II toxin-antitoxin system RelE/ParE family toxin [Stieleria sp. JC731]
MAEIEWTEEAERRLRCVHDYIAQDNPTAAAKVVVEIYEKIQLLSSHSRLGQRYEPIVDREVREIHYGHYRIPYLVASDDLIRVLGVFHSAMDLGHYLQ